MPRPAPRRRRILLGALIACTAGVLCLAQGAMAARNAEVSIMDDQLLLGASPERLDRAMKIFRGLGIDRVRVSAFWRDHAPAPTSRRRPAFDAGNHQDPAYRWETLDRVALYAAGNGLRLMISITTPAPLWATSAPRRGNPVLRPKVDEFALYARAVASRYAQFAGHWGLLNEPNQGAWLQPQSDGRGFLSPHLYRELVHAAYPQIKAGDPGGVVLVGELASSGRNDRGATRPIRPLEFLRSMACVNRRYRPIRRGRCRSFRPIPLDAVGHHPYALLAPPFARSPDGDDAAIGDGTRFLRVLDALVRRGRLVPSRRGRPLDVYYTEFGYQTNPPDPFAGVPLRTQDAWLQLAGYIAWRTPRIRGLNQFRLTDGSVGRGTRAFEEFQSGLIFRNGRLKPSYEHFRAPFVVVRTPRRGRRLRFWGHARTVSRPTPVVIERSPRRGRPYRRVATRTTNRYGYFSAALPGRAGLYRFSYGDARVRVRSGAVRISFARRR